jgi:hypothetical protein
VHAHKAVYRSREFGLRAIAGASPRKLYDVIVACGIRVVMAETIKNGLKWFFGRPWPETWRNNNSSWIGNHDYALQWLHGRGEFRSFRPATRRRPSPCSRSLWICYPRLPAL